MGKEIEMLILFNFLAERSMQSINEISMFVETVEKNTGEAVDLTNRVLQKMIASINKTSPKGGRRGSKRFVSCNYKATCRVS